jgi:hypothetical protein
MAENLVNKSGHKKELHIVSVGLIKVWSFLKRINGQDNFSLCQTAKKSLVTL